MNYAYIVLFYTIKNMIKMNKTEINGNWHEQKGKLKMKFSELTDDDFMYAEGKMEEMLGKIQIKLGKTKEEFLKIMTSLLD